MIRKRPRFQAWGEKPKFRGGIGQWRSLASAARVQRCRREGVRILAMSRTPSMREIVDALDWARREVMRRGSPDFIRQRELEKRVHELCRRLMRGTASPRRNGSSKL